MFAVALTMWSFTVLGGCAWFLSSKNRPVVETREPRSTVPLPKAAVKASVDPFAGKDDSSSKAGDSGRKGEQTTSPGDGKGKEPRFPKHDHARYIDEIKKKAQELLNQQEASADRVTLCQDNSTEQWSVTAYRKGNKSYSFVVYTWDPVDGAFKQTMDKSLISNLKHHLKHSRSGKTCSFLKGGDE
ncbi:MAG: hypothetical protein LDL33_05620 [Desulfomonile sp.]|nr:hypothetical protein [Desulfomonile sp.]